jgi:hypothetical protein
MILESFAEYQAPGGREPTLSWSKGLALFET